MRGSYDPQSLWALSGLAIRSGQRIGLHRDNTSENLSVFDAEMRRRLWWQILILDSRSAQLSGSATDRQLYLQWNTRRPLNVNDSDLHPAMQELPVEHPGISEMLFCSMRYEIGNFMRQSMKHENVDENGQMTKTSTSIAAKDRALDELEHHLEQKYLKYCDPSVPHHLLALYLGKSAICRLRLAAHFPRQQSGHNSTSRQDEKDTLFRTCLKTIEYDNDGRKNKSLQGYLWHVNVFFPYEAFIYILIELSERTEGDLVDHAWSQVDKAYENHPELISSSNNALHFAMGNLAIKAWRNRIGAAHIDQQLNESTTPHSILAVQNRRNAKSAQGTQSQHSENSTTPTDSNPTHINIDGTKSDDVSQDPYSAYSPNYGQTDINLLDWESWQALIEGRDLPMSGFDQQMVT